MLPLTLPILRTLSDGAFHSGENLAAQYGVSRASIWNALQGLDALGVRLFKIRGRGYQLADPIEWLNPSMIATHFGPSAKKIDLQILDVAESTNSLLMQRAAQAGHAQCLVAEMQTQGRGRRGRAWHGALGGSLTFSLLWRFNLGASQLSGLSLAVGVALVRALNELGYSAIHLKWPNDLVHGYRKLGGVLIEIQGDAMGPSTAVIGVGLNLHLPQQIKNKIDQAMVDLHTLMQPGVSRNALMGSALRHLTEMLVLFESEGFDALRAEWELAHAYHEKPVVIRMPDGAEIHGVVRGVAPDGALILDTPSGERRFGSGEMSMRPSPAYTSNELSVE
ncbi:MAG: biotin--[acetyl-CoA-carboxylase] ligase [Hydrogenophilales bacterium]|nr:biotin--[acetyl-CoA-carboxylase] ligase [Hydrogenophilales bacterium]